MNEARTREIYLTNGCCEDVFLEQMEQTGVRLDLQHLGLEFQEDHPLSEREQVFVADDEITLAGKSVAGGASDPEYAMLMGYSTLKDGRKFLAPAIEHMFEPDDQATYDAALAEVTAFADAVRPALETIGGSVSVVEEAMPHRHNVEIRVPMEYALATGLDYDGWVAHLKSQVLAAALVEVVPPPSPRI